MAEPRVWTELLNYGLGHIFAHQHRSTAVAAAGRFASTALRLVCWRLAADQLPGGDRAADPGPRTAAFRQKRRRDPAAQLSLREEIAFSVGYSAAANALLLIPFLAVLIGRKGVLQLLQSGKTALMRRGELVVGSLSFGAGGHLGWQGISGLMIS